MGLSDSGKRYAGSMVADGSPPADRLQIQWCLPLRRVWPALAWGIAFFTFMGLMIVVAKFTVQFDRVYGLYSLFDLGSDTSMPTWFSSLGLLICSALLAISASVSHRHADRLSTYWRGLAGVFLLLSIDEVARLHEVVGGFIGAQLQPAIGPAAGFLHYTWVLPGLMFVAVVGVVYIRFLWAVAARMRYRVIIAGAVYIGGAVAMEMLNARSAFLYSPHSVVYQLGTVVEECLEMTGVALFARALVLNLNDSLELFVVELASEPEQTPCPQVLDNTGIAG